MILVIFKILNINILILKVIVLNLKINCLFFSQIFIKKNITLFSFNFLFSLQKKYTGFKEIKMYVNFNDFIQFILHRNRPIINFLNNKF